MNAEPLKFVAFAGGEFPDPIGVIPPHVTCVWWENGLRHTQVIQNLGAFAEAEWLAERLNDLTAKAITEARKPGYLGGRSGAYGDD